RLFFICQEKFIVDLIIDDITEIKQAEKSSSETKLKNKLFSKLAHEFKTPLIIIKNMVNDLVFKINSDLEVENIQDQSNNISYLSEYINYLINDIIVYSNEEAIKVQIE